MKKILILFLFTSYCHSQTKDFSTWKSDLDNYLTEIGTPNPNPKGKDAYDAAVKSHSLTDMYFEGYSFIYGLTRAWQATGDFSYLDKALFMAEEEIRGAVYLVDFYTTGDGANANAKKLWYYYGNVTLPNYYQEKYNYTFPSDGSFSYYFPNVRDYNANAVNDKYSFNYVAARDPTENYDLQPLGENIYYRYVADMLRVMNHNSSILSIRSGNGQTYQQRFDFILAYLEKNIFEKWVEFESNSRHWEFYVARENTHMSSHLPSIAISLYSITKKQKYIDFVEEFLYDFGSNPKSSNIPAGIGMLDQLENINGNILWARDWGDKPSKGGDQDVPHSGAEYHFFLQCYEEGIGANPPNGEIPVDMNLINGLINTFKNLTLPTGTDMCSKTNLHEDIDGGGSISYAWAPVQGQFAYAQYSSEMLCFAEYNKRGSIQKVGDIGNILYAKRALGIDGLSPPVYPNKVRVADVDLDNDVSLKIHPNPATEGSNITITGAKPNDTYVLSMYNMSGQLMANDLLEIVTENIEHNLPPLSPDLYIVTLKSRTSKYKGKLIVQ